MARNKRALSDFLILITDTDIKTPRTGCRLFRNAISALREYVAENAPYATEVLVDGADQSEPWRIQLSCRSYVRLPTGDSVQGKLRRDLDIEGDIAAQVKSFAEAIRDIESRSTQTWYAIGELQKETNPAMRRAHQERLNKCWVFPA